MNDFIYCIKKCITKEFENYIINGGLDSYDRTVRIAFSLNDDYEVVMNDEIKKIARDNKSFDCFKLSLFLKEFVEKMNYEDFYNSFKSTHIMLIEKFKEVLNIYGKTNFKLIEDFFGYSIGYMEIVLCHFSNGSYGMTFCDHITYVSCIMNKGEFDKHVLSTLFHEFSHPYVNSLGKKYFSSKDLKYLLINSKENGLAEWYTNSIILINEHIVRAVQIILGKKIFEKEYILNQVNHFKKIGYLYIEELIKIIKLKENYISFEEFYNKEIVSFL